MKLTSRNRIDRVILLMAVASVVFIGFSSLAHAGFTDAPTDWDNFLAPTGYTVPYTFNGQPVQDHESSSDPTNGGSAVAPSSIDLASGSPDGANPGPYDTPSYGYYNGGTDYDPEDPSTLEDDYVLFTMRLVGDPSSSKEDFAAYHWNVLVDVDNDGYKEYWIDLEGSYSQKDDQNEYYDRVQVLYDNANSQEIADPDAARVEEFSAYSDITAVHFSDYSHTRLRQDASTGDYWIDIQVPMTAFNDLDGNQVLYPNSPVGFVFSTSASNTNPLQKDFMTDLDFLTTNDPISFGDIVKSNGEPDLYFANSQLEEKDFYEEEDDDVYLYLRDPLANTDSGSVETVTATVSDPITGDDETVTLTESGPNTGIFTNLGGADTPVSSEPSDGWISFVQTTVISEADDYTVTYVSATGDWSVCGATPPCQATNATAGTEYTSDDGMIIFTLYEDNPADGDYITFSTYAGDPLTTTAASGGDDDGNLEVGSGDPISYSYTNSSSETYTDTAQIVGVGDPFIQFTRSDGSPSTNFELTADPGTSDLLYVTVYHSDSNANPSVAETIQVVLTGSDTQTLTLTETGPDTGIFRNTTGLQTKTSDGSIDTEDNLWEDLDQGEVTATFTYLGTPYATTTTLFYTEDAGRVYFVNGAGTVDVEQYAADQPVFIKLEDGDSTSCMPSPLTVTITSDTTGDSETVTLYETSPGSNVYMNRVNDLVTGDGNDEVISASSTFQTDGVSPGDTFVIATGPDAGVYTVATVDSETQITLSQTLTADRTNIGFNAQPLMTATDDGGTPTADDGILESANGETLTVTYDDCYDGDGESSNDLKTDEATYNAPPIVINEVMFYPDTTVTGIPTEREYIQLYNASNAPVDLTDYTVTDEATDPDGGDFSYQIVDCGGSSVVLDPGQAVYIVLVPTDSPDDDCPSIAGDPYYLYATVTDYDELGDPNTADTADQISLYDDTGTIVDYVGWSTTSINTIDFKSDDESAVAQAIWEDNNYKDVATDPIARSEVMYRCSDGVDTDTADDWCYKSSTVNNFIITAAIVSSFRVLEEGNDIVVEWETASEIGTVGFYLYRKGKRTRHYRQLNEELLPALLGAQQGGNYRYADETASYGETYKYMLVEVEASGRQRKYGPFAVTVGEQDGGETGAAKISQRSQSNKKLRGMRAGRKEQPKQRMFQEKSGLSRFGRDKGKGFRRPDGFDGSGRYSYKARQMSKHEKARREDAKWYSQAAEAVEAAATGDEIRIAVSEDGLYYVDAWEISDLLGLGSREVKRIIKKSGLSLSNQGEQVAYFPADGNTGIYFYGKGIDSIYTDENVYWLSRGRGLEMERTNGPGPALTWGDDTFTRTVHAEEDRFPTTALFSDPQDDYWLWNFALAGGGHTSFGIRTDGVSQDFVDAFLTAHLKGITDTDTDPDHHVVVSINGVEIGEGYWDGTTAHELVLPFDQSLLDDGENFIEVLGLADTGAPYSMFCVDSFDLTYQSYYYAVDNKLLFRGDGNPVVTVFGFGTPNIMVFEVTDPKRPRRVESKTIERTGGAYSVTIEPASPEALYFAVSNDAVISELDARADMPSTLATSDNRAEYLVIAPPGLKSGAQRLADYRQGQGLYSMVVNLGDIMDEFNHGIYSPRAIQDFLSYAYKHWNMPPTYVVLVGDGTFDYKDNLGYGDNLMPPLMVNTPDGLYASDNRFVDVMGDDGVPEMAIGRLPVLTDEELQGVIDKIIAYEYATGGWARRVLMLADNPDGGGNFPADSANIAGVVRQMGYAPEEIYLSELPIDAARKRVFDGINNGAAILNYIGHAGLDRLSDEGLLLTSDLDLLNDGERLPVVTAMTCVVGRFALPGFDSLSEAFLVTKDRGGVAVWAPTGGSVNARARILDEEFFRAALTGRGTTLGAAILSALEAYGERGGEQFMLDIYNLMGDPALELK